MSGADTICGRWTGIPVTQHLPGQRSPDVNSFHNPYLSAMDRHASVSLLSKCGIWVSLTCKCDRWPWNYLPILKRKKQTNGD